ncbi:MAG: alanine--tRNA ligase [Clostridiales bacterium]|nr:alanine--tRNA ligase [Clostridiales bacterium]
MKKYTSKELRETWLNFYKSKGHVDIGAVSLIGDGTTGVMFNVAGMQPLMPYLLGEKHKDGVRLCNVQGCVRTIDIDSVGDESHCTFFEMMGNWSLGDYFKKEKTAWTFELLTEVFGLDKSKICSTVFAGNESAPRDEETAELLKGLGIKEENIFYLGKEDNWWELAGTTGTPCGPDNEWFYPLTDEKCSDNCDINCQCNRYVEIGNDVYMQYEKLEDGYRPLKNKNVDTGFGFERMLMFLNGLRDVYRTDLFVDVVSYIESQTGIKYGEDAESTKSIRIICDHMRTALMLIGDKNGIVPSNVGAGYILRRLLRRAIRHARKINFNTSDLREVANIYIDKVYDKAYPLLVDKKQYILSEIQKEVDKFNKTIELGTKEFEKLLSGIEKKIAFLTSSNPDYVAKPEDREISGKSAFRLYDTFGFPIEMTIEMAEERGIKVDEDGFREAFAHHQELARTTSAGAFKSGLGGNGEMETKYHTATHLLNAALKRVIGESSCQKGSNITAERLRFDFACDHKMTAEELKETEALVNSWIAADYKVECQEMPKTKAVEIGAEHQFLDRYPDIVTVYSIGEVSKEICTGPHVKSIGELGKFVIKKEEASSSGVRRIKAILE